MPETLPAHVPSPRTPLGWDGTRYRALAVDVLGRLQVDCDGGCVGVRVYRNANQLIPDSAWTMVSFNAQRWDVPDNDQWVLAPNPTRLTCQWDGIYVITGNVSWEANVTGIRMVRIVVNDAVDVARTQAQNLMLNAMQQIVTTTYKLVAGDFVELAVYQSSGGNLNVLTAADYSAEFSMVRCNG